jgi:AcrR family transcriptional regulator
VKKQPAIKRQRSARVAQKHEQARLDILEAAQRILLKGGVEAVTLASVAGELHMTKQALYHYFPSKDALVRKLVATLFDDEIKALVAAVEKVDSGTATLGTLIRAFYEHYIGRLDTFRSVYCQAQLYSGAGPGFDKDTVHKEINPRTRHLFDVLEARIAGASASKAKRERMRRLAFSAWLSALGLVTMLGVADAVKDPLAHSDEDLLDTLSTVFDDAAKRWGNTAET